MHFPFPSPISFATRIFPAIRYFLVVLSIIQLSLLTFALTAAKERIWNIAFSTLATCMATLSTWRQSLPCEKEIKSNHDKELKAKREWEGVEDKVRLHMEQWKRKDEERLRVERKNLEKERNELEKELEGIV